MARWNQSRARLQSENLSAAQIVKNFFIAPVAFCAAVFIVRWI
jgi:hypothetical protein